MRFAKNHGFVLLEVLVALVIISIGATAVLRSLQQSLKAARQAEIINRAALLAESLVEEIQINPPLEGKYDGGFGEDAPDYRYELVVEEEKLRYRGSQRKADEDDFRPVKMAHIEIFLDRPDQDERSARIIKIDSAILGMQKFSGAALNHYQLYELY